MHFTIRDQIALAKEGHRLRDPSDARLATAVSALADTRAAERLVANVGRAGLRQMSAPELAAVGKIALATAERIVAARELGGLLAQRDPVANSPVAVLDRLPPGLAALETEVMLGFALTAGLAIKALFLLSKGGVSGTALTPRDVFVPLARMGASGVIVVHNHPSGSAVPSQEDIRFTNVIAQAGQLLGIDLVDHIIVAANGIVSFADSGLLPTQADLAELSS